MSKQLQIRNSTAEFLIFQAEDKAQGVQVFYQDENIWATQDAIATLFDKGRTTITEHLKNIYQTGELDEQTTCRKFRHMGSTGQEYETKYYNLDAIISVGYRVNSIRATQFRRWATSVLRQFAIKGYVLDRKRMENGAILGMSRAEIQSKLDEIIDFSGCERYIDTPVKRYSSGMTVRLGFAVAAFLEPEILVVDEVLAVGDLEFQDKAIGKMKDVNIRALGVNWGPQRKAA